jgi:hypothetical protein
VEATREKGGEADYGEPLATNAGLQGLDLGLDVFHARHCAGAGRAELLNLGNLAAVDG